jgi:uncharacterized OB-fold protein
MFKYYTCKDCGHLMIINQRLCCECKKKKPSSWAKEDVKASDEAVRAYMETLKNGFGSYQRCIK